MPTYVFVGLGLLRILIAGLLVLGASRPVELVRLDFLAIVGFPGVFAALVLVNGFLLGSLSVVVIGQLVQRLTYDNRAAFIAAGLWAVWPGVLWLSPWPQRLQPALSTAWLHGLAVPLAVFLALIGLRFVVRALDERRARLTILSSAAFGAMLVFGVQLVWVLLVVVVAVVLKRHWSAGLGPALLATVAVVYSVHTSQFSALSFQDWQSGVNTLASRSSLIVGGTLALVIFVWGARQAVRQLGWSRGVLLCGTVPAFAAALVVLPGLRHDLLQIMAFAPPFLAILVGWLGLAFIRAWSGLLSARAAARFNGVPDAMKARDRRIDSATVDGLQLGTFARLDLNEADLFTPNDAPDAWDGRAVLAGDVIRVGDEFWLYYTGYGAGQGIGLATSADGRSWKRAQDSPVFKPGPPGSWDAAYVQDPALLYDAAAGQFKMWYMGVSDESDDYSFGLGYATSPDGIHWARVGAAPVITHGEPGAWDEERIGGLNVVKVGETYYLYYTATTLQPTFRRQIGRATSVDGINWRECLGNPLLSPQPYLAPFEGLEVEDPHVIHHGGLWLMAYSGYLGPQGNAFHIGLARSADGMHWERLSSQPILPWGPPGAFDCSTTRDPVLFLELERQLLWLWYTGEGQGRQQIGGATAVVSWS